MSLIGVDVQGIDELQAKLKKLPPAMQDAVVDDVSAYLVKAFQDQPPPNYVTRASAYGQTFFTDKQRRWFFAAINRGEITVPYRRTQAMRNGWQIIDKGKSAIIVNETPGIEYVMGDRTQSRHEAAVGWKTIGKIVIERGEKIMKIADAAVKKAIKKCKLG